MPPAADDPRIEFARRRTAHATFRTSLALERTTLAWIRTTLTFETFGLGMIALLISAWSHARALRILRRGDAPRLPLVPLSVAIGSCVGLLCL